MNASTLKAQISPVEFYRVEIPTMPQPSVAEGWADGGLCPFHDDNNTGNFRVHLGSGAYICFSCEAKGGDIISFIQRKLHTTFMFAFQMIGESWGVSV